jgi:hypothetical protein
MQAGPSRERLRREGGTHAAWIDDFRRFERPSSPRIVVAYDGIVSFLQTDLTEDMKKISVPLLAITLRSAEEFPTFRRLQFRFWNSNSCQRGASLVGAGANRVVEAAC